MRRARKFNVVELYYDTNGTIMSYSTDKIFPSSEYQTVLYVNSKSADRENIMGISFYIDGRIIVPEAPMRYLGKFKKDGEFFERWSYMLGSDVTNNFRRDREIKLSISVNERSVDKFLGIFDNFDDLPENKEESTRAYVLDNSQMYEYVNDDWVESSKLQVFEQVFGYSIADLMVSKGFKSPKKVISEDITDTIFGYLAKLQGQISDGENLSHAIEDIYYDLVEEKFVFVKFNGDEIRISIPSSQRLGENLFVQEKEPEISTQNDLWIKVE